jgi:hypothetical protein
MNTNRKQFIVYAPFETKLVTFGANNAASSITAKTIPFSQEIVSTMRSNTSSTPCVTYQDKIYKFHPSGGLLTTYRKVDTTNFLQIIPQLTPVTWLSPTGAVLDGKTGSIVKYIDIHKFRVLQKVSFEFVKRPTEQAKTSSDPMETSWS